MNKRVAIIGGGYTGMVAALRLSQTGDFVCLYEKSTVLGGLATGIKFQGTTIERAYHHIFRTDRDIIKLAGELGCEDKLHWYPSSIAVVDQHGTSPFASPFDLLKFSRLPLRDRIRLGAVLFYLQQKPKWSTTNTVTATQWLRRACGERVYRVVWEPLLVGKFHDAAPEVSMAWLWARVHTRAASRSLLRGEELGYFEGGFQTFTHALEQQLRKQGVQVIFGSSVSSLRTLPDRQVTLTVGDERKVFDAVICTIPSRVFASLIVGDLQASPDYLTQLNAMEYLGAICITFSTPQSLSRFYWHNINYRTSPFLVFIQHTNLVSAASYQGQHVYYLGAYLPHEHELFRAPPEHLQATFFTHLQKFFPMFNPARVTEIVVSKLPYAQHVVGQNYSSIRPSVQTPLPNVYLSNFSQIFPEDRGTNFAVRAGNDVAQQVLRSVMG